MIAQLSLLLATAVAPMQRHAVIIGHNEGADASRTLAFAEQDAEKFARTLVELGGFARQDVHILRSPDADDVWRTLDAVGRALRQATGPTMLVLYYSGHADGTILELGDSELRFDALTQYLEKSPATVRLAFLDACQSGRLARAKGWRRVPRPKVQIRNPAASAGYAIITSSSDEEASHEAREIGGSFFSHYLVVGLRGAADSNRDGRVSLDEAYRFAYGNTVARTSAWLGRPQHPMYKFKLSGQGDVVLTEPRQTPSAVAAHVESPGRLLVFRPSRRSLEYEAPVRKGQRVHIPLVPDRYRVYLVDASGAVKHQAVDLAPTEVRQLQTGGFESYRGKNSVAKGGLLELEPGPPPTRLLASALIRTAPIDAVRPLVGLAVGVEHPVGRTYFFGALSAATAMSGPLLRYQELGARAGMGHTPFDQWKLAAELQAGADYILQETDDDQRYRSSAFGGALGLRYSRERLGLHLVARANLTMRGLKLLNTGWTLRLTPEIQLGVAF